MNSTSKRKLYIGLAAVGRVGLTWTASSVYAAMGIPSPGALSYKGTLQDGDGPVEGVADITIALYDSAGMAQELCTHAAGATPVTGGRFEVELADACTDAVENNDKATAYSFGRHHLVGRTG